MSTAKQHINDSNTSRIAVLEQIAKETHETLGEIKREMKDIRNDINNAMGAMRSESWSQFRWLLGIMLTLFLASTTAIITILTKSGHI